MLPSVEKFPVLYAYLWAAFVLAATCGAMANGWEAQAVWMARVGLLFAAVPVIWRFRQAWPSDRIALTALFLTLTASLVGWPDFTWELLLLLSVGLLSAWRWRSAGRYAAALIPIPFAATIVLVYAACGFLDKCP